MLEGQQLKVLSLNECDYQYYVIKNDSLRE